MRAYRQDQVARVNMMRSVVSAARHEILHCVPLLTMTRRKAALRAERVVSYTSYAIQKRDVQFEPKISPFLWNYLKKSCSTPIFVFHIRKDQLLRNLY